MVEQKRWLIDKSAYARLAASPDFEVWCDRMRRGLVAIAPVSLLEIGFSARSGADWRRIMSEPPITWLISESMTPRVEARMAEVQGLLAKHGNHRAAKIPDLMIAAVAEVNGYTILHVDKDFDLISEITGQDVERLSGDF